MRCSSLLPFLFASLAVAAASCTLFIAGTVTPCDDDDDCGDGDVCNAGFCNGGGGDEGEGEGDKGEGEGEEGEGEEGEGDEGEGEEGEGEGIIVVGEGEGEEGEGEEGEGEEGEGEPPPVFFEFCGDVPPPPWADPAFAHRLPISFCDVGAPVGTVVDLPVLIKVTDAAVLAQFQQGGRDVRFIDQRDGTTGQVLSHERVVFGAASATFFVKMPTLDPRSERDHIWMYFGSAAAPDVSAGAGTFSAYNAVFHMEDASGFDSKAGRATDVVGNEAINPGSSRFKVAAGAGLVDNAVDFNNAACNLTNGDNCKFMILDDDNNLGGNNAFGLNPGTGTISLVVGRRLGGAAMSNGQAVFYADGQAPRTFGFDNRSVHFTVGDTGGDPDGAVGFSVPTNPATNGDFDASAGGTLPRANFSHVVITWTANNIKIFVNGTFVSERNINVVAMNPRFVDLGTSQELGNMFTGSIDELRLTNATRDAAFIRADFKSTTNALNTFGPVENR